MRCLKKMRRLRLRSIAGSSILLLLATLPSIGASQISEATAKATALDWFEKFEIETIGKTVHTKYSSFPQNSTSYYRVQIDEALIWINGNDGSLRAFADMKRASDMAKGFGRTAPDQFVQQSVAELRANEIEKLIKTKILGYTKDELKIYPDDYTLDPVRRGRCEVRYSPRPFGRDPNRVGNCVSFVFDVQDGKLIDVHLVREWTYNDSEIKISSSVAGEKATAILRAQRPAASNRILSIDLGYIHPNKDLGSTTGDTLSRGRIAPYAYTVALETGVVFITRRLVTALVAHSFVSGEERNIEA